MMKTKLYLQGSLQSDGTYLHCPLTSGAIVYVINYCHMKDFELVFVPDSEVDQLMPCALNMSTFADMDVTIMPWSEVPQLVRNVSLPSLYEPNLSLVRCGLCVLLRHIIKESHRAMPDLHLVDLLGFRQGSMKMCSEVSGWTKLCEVELSHSIAELIACLEKKGSESGDGKTVLTIPNDLMKLEGHFQKKCRVHNDDKKRRVELARLKKEVLARPEETSKVDCSKHHEGKDDTTLAGTAIVNTASSGDCVMPSDAFLSKTSDVNSSTLPSSEVFIDKFSFKDMRLQIEQVVQLPHGTRKVKVDKTFDTCIGKIKSPTKTVKSTPTEPSMTAELSVEGEDMANFINQLTYQDIEYVHTYSEGIEMTVADLILFVYLYYLLEALDFSSKSLATHVPSLLEWGRHMTSLATVAAACERSGWDVKELAKCLAASSEGVGHHKHSSSGRQNRDVLFVKEAEVVEDGDEMELSRCAKMKHKALKPEVTQALGKFEAASINPVTGCHPCGDKVEIDWASLPAGIHPKEGDVPEKRTNRKCQQLENLVTAVQAVAKPGDVLVDFCSGGGHLGIVMAYLLPECQVFLVENKEESLLKACSRLESLNLINVTLYQCNLDYFIGKFDVGVCLHACGSATDMVLQLCLNTVASFVICPCCYGSIQKTHLLSYPRSKQFMQTNVTYKDFLTLGHAADQTEFSIALEGQGRQCMNLVDTDRAEYARELGYTVTLCTLKPLSCTPKNNLLIGTPHR